ncbi:SprT-like domain-containing protein [Achromobacter phage Motura]|uniref:SprT-like domain-containing protein n=1 Tax=Achromobacter phage Motura TaxID=2591403 RepID=A0A514CT33_9CAUD|nr:SprT-like domain-containing protein [Achromobacter phage Motura]QDH83610.1 SprT-like domain-containing protein [Achromobacter phage Motura]
MQCTFCGPIFARAFSSNQNLQQSAASLQRRLKLGGLPVMDPVQVKTLAVLGYTQWLPHEVTRILKKLDFSPWSRNPAIWVHNGNHYPIQVLDDRVILMGETVPDWTNILKEVAGYATATFSNTTYPLGAIEFRLTNPTQFIKEWGFVPKGGQYYSEDVGLKLKVENGKVTMYQSASGYAEAKTVKLGPSGNPVADPEDQDIPVVDKDLIDDTAPSLNKYGLQQSALDKLDSIRSNSPNQAKLLTIKYLWNLLNKSKFKGELDEPNFTLLKDQGSHFKLRGYWQRIGRNLALSPRLFNAKPEIFLEILVHEMCHQATSEISMVYSEPEAGHGPVWKSWMVKCGLDPSRYDKNSNDDYLTPEQRKVADYVKSHKLSPKDEGRGTICGMYNSKDGTIREVVILSLKVWKQRAAAEVITSQGNMFTATLGLLCWLPKYKFKPNHSVQILFKQRGIEQLKPATK